MSTEAEPCTDCGAKLLPWEGERYAGRCESCGEVTEKAEAEIEDIDAEIERLEDELDAAQDEVDRLNGELDILEAKRDKAEAAKGTG